MGYNSQHLGSENSSLLKIIDKIDNTYTEMISDQIYLNPKQGKEIFYRSIIDLEIHDFDSDGINDIIIWLSQEEMYENFFDDNGKFIGNTKTSSVDDLGFESMNYFILIKGSSTGYDLENLDLSNNILYQYESEFYDEHYSFDIVEISDGNYILYFMDVFTSGRYENFSNEEYNGRKSKLYAVEIDGKKLTDITDSHFKDSVNINYIFPANEPTFIDFNNDGLKDIYFWGGWDTNLDTPKSLFLLNKSTHFENVVLPFSNNQEPLFADFNNDGFIELFQNLDNSLKYATNLDLVIDGNFKRTDDSLNNKYLLELTFNDIDRDGVSDSDDNCVNTYNPDQIDTDADGIGNICDVLNQTTGVPKILGDFKLGSTLTVNLDELKDDDGIGSFNYQWYADNKIIDDANSSTYKLLFSDLNKGIKVVVEHVDLKNNKQSIQSKPIGPWGEYQFLSDHIKNAQGAVVRITASTAVMISPTHAITAAHSPLDENNEITPDLTVQNIFGEVRDIVNVIYDIPADFAIVELESPFENSYSVQIADNDALAGDTAFAIGNPKDTAWGGVGWAVSFGFARDILYKEFYKLFDIQVLGDIVVEVFLMIKVIWLELFLVQQLHILMIVLDLKI